jgi:hypothetical protein
MYSNGWSGEVNEMAAKEDERKVGSGHGEKARK